MHSLKALISEKKKKKVFVLNETDHNRDSHAVNNTHAKMNSFTEHDMMPIWYKRMTLIFSSYLHMLKKDVQIPSHTTFCPLMLLLNDTFFCSGNIKMSATGIWIWIFLSL